MDHSLVWFNEIMTHAVATPDGQDMVESSEKTWSSGEGNGKPLQYSCLKNPMISMKRWKCLTLEDELPRLEGAQICY